MTSASAGGCKAYDEIVALGDLDLGFLREHGKLRFGRPKHNPLRSLMNRIDPNLFEAAFTA